MNIMTNIDIYPIFSSFLINQKLDLDTKAIRNWIEREYHKDLHTDYEINLHLKEEALKDFYFRTNYILDNVHNALGFSKNTKQQIQKAWVNVDCNKKTSVSVPHVHASADYICVYYPYVEDGSGILELMNPNSSVEYVFPSAQPSIVESYNIFNSRIWKIVPENDSLVIFPSWLIHYVRPGNPNTTRMSIALNSKIITNV